MILLLCGLVGFALSQYLKIILRLKTGYTGWAKMAAALVGSGLVAGLVFHRNQNAVIYAIAGAGLAMVIHKLYRYLSAKGDDLIEIIVERNRRR